MRPVSRLRSFIGCGVLAVTSTVGDYLDEDFRSEVSSRRHSLFPTGSSYTVILISVLLGAICMALFSTVTRRFASLQSRKIAMTTPRSINKWLKEELKLVLVVRQDLKMGKGKIGAQCGHASVGIYRRAVKSKDPYLDPWLEQGQRKIVVKDDSEASILLLRNAATAKGINTYVVYDAGRTQIASGSLTVLAIGPAPESQLQDITGHLKLL